MLGQVVALLSLGVLCSSAPMPGSSATRTRSHSQQEEHLRTLVGYIIQEVLQDMQKLNLNAAPSITAVNATVERCMHSHLKTFAATLAADLNEQSKLIARKLNIVTNKITIPKDLDKECEAVQVTRDVFLETLDRFLRLLFENIQST